MDKKMTREQAEKLADELLSQQPRYRDSPLAEALPVLNRLLEAHTVPDDDKPNPYVTPASPLWDVVHRKTDTTKIGG